MSQRTDIQSMELATLSLSASLPATYDAAGYGATALTFTAIGKIENFGNHGMTAQVGTFTPVDTGVTTKTKGSKDYGKMSLTIGNVPGDAGQALLATAAESKAHYSAKISYPIGDGESVGEVHYLDVLVSKREFQDGDVNAIRKLIVDLDICRKPVEVAAT